MEAPSLSRRAQFTDAQILDALEKSAGVQVVAARLLAQAHGRPCSRNQLCLRIHRSKALRERVDELFERQVDLAEGQLYRAIKAGESWAVMFLLKTRGKTRGWTEKLDVSGNVTHTHRRGPDIDPDSATSEELDDYMISVCQPEEG